MAQRKSPKYTEIDGFILDDSFLPERFISATKYKPKAEDVIIATYPKCGTTWMCQIAILILRKGVLPCPDEYFKSCPFLEYQGAIGAEEMIRPGCIKTHLPFDRVVFSREAKYIYVARHPQDCVVSFYHHTKFFPNYYFTDGSFDDFFELFIRGKTDFNDYFDNLLSWYERRNDSNVFFITYEDMKADHKGSVLRVAKFLGDEYYSALTANDGEMLEKIVSLSSFDYMKNTTNETFKDYFLKPKEGEDELSKRACSSMKKALEEGERSCGNFIRTGQVGSGKTILSEKQKQKLKDRILEKTRGSDVMTIWG